MEIVIQDLNLRRKDHRIMKAYKCLNNPSLNDYENKIFNLQIIFQFFLFFMPLIKKKIY